MTSAVAIFIAVILALWFYLGTPNRRVRTQFLTMSNTQATWIQGWGIVEPSVNGKPVSLNLRLTPNEITFLYEALKDKDRFVVAHIYLSAWWTHKTGRRVDLELWKWDNMEISSRPQDKRILLFVDESEMPKIQSLWGERLQSQLPLNSSP